MRVIRRFLELVMMTICLSLDPAHGRRGEVHLVLAPVGLRHRGLKTRGEVLLTLRGEVTRMLSEPQ